MLAAVKMSDRQQTAIRNHIKRLGNHPEPKREKEASEGEEIAEMLQSILESRQTTLTMKEESLKEREDNPEMFEVMLNVSDLAPLADVHTPMKRMSEVTTLSIDVQTPKKRVRLDIHTPKTPKKVRESTLLSVETINCEEKKEETVLSDKETQG
jgi:hypothetical protein